MVEGRRYKNEPAPINDSLERHYKEEIKRLEKNNADLEHDLNEMRCEIERLHFKIKLKDVEIDSLVKALAGGEM
jgi:predicted  nucleic acid-binding Zn-ribbon protein